MFRFQFQQRPLPFLFYIILGVGMATLVRAFLTPLWGSGYPYITYYPVILLRAVIAGWAYALLAIGLATVLSAWLFLSAWSDPPQLVSLFAFGGINLVLIFVIDRIRRERSRIEQVLLGSEQQILHDLQEHARTEEALRLSEARLHSILDRAPTMIFMKDPDGRYLFMNDQCARVLRVDRDAIKGKTDHELLPANQATQFMTNDQKVWKSGRLLVVEERATQTDGLHTYLVQKFLLHDSAGHPYALCGIALDMTAQKHTEAALRESENNLRRLTQQLENLVDDRTHELVQSQERLRAMAFGLNLTEQRERKRLAIELHDHLQQLLVLAKLRLGQSKRVVQSHPAFEEVLKDTDEVLSQALTYTRTLVTELSPPVLHHHGLVAGLKWLSEYMKQRDQQVTVIVSEDTHLELPEDQTVVVFQSVRELLINITKHAGTRDATVTLDQLDDEVRIQVMDEGLGFDLAMSSRQQTDGLSSKFGLFSVAERMRAVGGAFEIESEVGKGTIATLRVPLPRRRSADGTNDPLDTLASDHGTLTVAPKVEQSMVSVLLVDDHAMIRQGLRSLLEAYPDVTVIGEASNGEDAVAAVEELNPSVVVMDIDMPKMNGIDATAAIKARHPAITVIGLSINTDAENQLAMAKAGASVLLTKEAAVDTLYTAIRSIVQVRNIHNTEKNCCHEP